MGSVKEIKIFEDFLAAKRLKHSLQRRQICDIFLSIDRHLTADELYRIVKQKNPSFGYATVYRTLKLLCASGLSREVKFRDDTVRYEHLLGHKHHDHLVCTRCGKLIEVVDEGIEQLQDKLFRQYAFSPQGHRMELYGICKKCKK